MYYTPETAIQVAEARQEIPEFGEKDRASVIALATDEFECVDCGHVSDPYVFAIQAGEQNVLAIACPVCILRN